MNAFPATELSVVIPYYNRAATLPFTLRSVREATRDLRIETIIVDDGSNPPAEEQHRGSLRAGERVLRQDNHGLLFARLAGLREAGGEFVLFLDSDDLVAPEKFIRQIAAMRAQNADVSYSDVAHCIIDGAYESLRPTPDAPLATVSEPADFFILVQPPPHSPIFRTAWLRRVVADAYFPPSPLYNSVAEIWFYHNAAPRPARIVYVPGPHTVVGVHPGPRLTDQWERLGVASLAVMEAFARTCPRTPTNERARRLVGEAAFRSWRRLPHGFSSEFAGRLLALWRQLASGESRALGGGGFAKLARVIGAERAGRLLKRLRNGHYDACRTMDDSAFIELLRALPNR